MFGFDMDLLIGLMKQQGTVLFLLWLAFFECFLYLLLRSRDEKQDARGNGRRVWVSQNAPTQIPLADDISRSISSTEDLAELASIQEDIGLLRLLNGVSSEPAWVDEGGKGGMSTFEVSRA